MGHSEAGDDNSQEVMDAMTWLQWDNLGEQVEGPV